MRMKEETNVTTHLNDFNAIFTQLVSQRLDFGEKVKFIFMLCSLPPSRDTFYTTISNLAPTTGLVYNDVIGSLLTEEICQKSMESTTHGAAHVTTSEKPRGCTQKHDKSKERTCNKSRNPKKDIECYYCGKLGHISKDCHSCLRDIKKGKQIGSKKDKDKDKDEEKNLNVVTSSNTPTLLEDLSTSDILVFTLAIEANTLVA